MKKRSGPRYLFFLAAILGIAVGITIAWRIRNDSGELNLSFLRGYNPTEIQHRPDGHYLRAWVLPGDLETYQAKLQKELQLSDGWQPMTYRSVHPPVIQFIRVRDDHNDFQFIRLKLWQQGPQKVAVTLDEGPKQIGAFR